MKVYDVAVIGAGVVGCCIARELSRYSLSTIVLEAGSDIANGATRANSGIVHAGFDPMPGSNKARYNVEGARLFPQWSAELGFTYIPNESMVTAFDDEEALTLAALLERGIENGAFGNLEIVDGDEARRLEPNLSPNVKSALVAHGGAICNPYELALAAAENAASNGVDFAFLSAVRNVELADAENLPNNAKLFRLTLSSGESLHARTIVNAAGVYADEINNMVSENKLSIVPVKGEYCLYEPAYGTLFQRSIFQTPTKKGKGVLVSPTVHGNLFIGPTSEAQESKADLSTTEQGLASLLEKGRITWPEASKKGIITNFAGLRAHGTAGDFVIGEAADAPGFYNAACIESPGLSAAPAIAVQLASDIAERLCATKDPLFNPLRSQASYFVCMSDEDRKKAIAEDPRWGNIVCQCCKVTEAELVKALHGPLPILSFDSLKWRCGATMGPCHGGFCTPEVMTIIARELNMAPTCLEKRLPGSWMASSAREDHATLALETATKHHQHPAPKQTRYDVVVVGAGAAGIAAAKRASAEGASVLLVDRGKKPGGILLQCIHSGFGLHRFKEELTGPEYALREAGGLGGNGPEFLPRATVLSIGEPQCDTESARQSGDSRASGQAEAETYRSVSVVCAAGLFHIKARAIVLATGSHERGLGSLNMAGSRPSGVYSAGSAQALINLQGCLPGKRAVILGSGDIGLIMARRMSIEGMEVAGVYEIADRPSGLRRNIVQCLDDFGIPLHTSQTITKLEGAARLEAVWVSDVDPRTWQPIEGTEKRVPCDTLVLSIGLDPESDLAKDLGIQLDPRTKGPLVNDAMETSQRGIFTCGNALHIHDLADYASTEGDTAGKSAALHALGANRKGDPVPFVAKEGVRYTVPQSACADYGCTEDAPYGTEHAGADNASRNAEHAGADNARHGTEHTASYTVSFRVTKAMRRPLMEVTGVCADGTKRILAKTKCSVAVPAEMIRMTFPIENVHQYRSIEVSAVERGEK